MANSLIARGSSGNVSRNTSSRYDISESRRLDGEGYVFIKVCKLVNSPILGSAVTVVS